MQRFFGIILIITMVLGLFACSQKQEKENANENTHTTSETVEQYQTKPMTVDEFCTKAQGWWAYAEGDVCYILNISDKKWVFGSYPGSMGQEGNIKDIIVKDEKTFNVTVNYPETYMYDHLVPEKDVIYTISTEDGFENSLIEYAENQTQYNYVYAGQHDYTGKCEQLLKQGAVIRNNKEEALPYVPLENKILGTSYSTFKAKGGVSYEIPDNGFLTTVTRMKDTAADGIEYICVADKQYVGKKGDTIAAYVHYGDPVNNLVNDWVKKDEFYDTPPRIATYEDFVALGWKLKNGYMVISAIPTNNAGEWYRYRASWVMYVESLEQCDIQWK